MNYIESGQLIINAFMARDAIPVEGVLVTVKAADENNRGEEHSRITDEDGLTAPIKLSAPSVDYSLSPSPIEQPYATYNVRLSKPGFYTNNIDGVAVFAGQTTVLPVNMITIGNEGEIPRGNLDFTSRENPSLE